MKDERMAILSMVEKGIITVEEAERLFAVIDKGSGNVVNLKINDILAKTGDSLNSLARLFNAKTEKFVEKTKPAMEKAGKKIDEALETARPAMKKATATVVEKAEEFKATHAKKETFSDDNDFYRYKETASESDFDEDVTIIPFKSNVSKDVELATENIEHENIADSINEFPRAEISIEETVPDETIISDGDEPINEETIISDGDEPINEEIIISDGDEPINEETIISDGDEPINEETIISDGDEPINEEIIISDGDEPITEETIVSNAHPTTSETVAYDSYKPTTNETAAYDSYKPTTNETATEKKVPPRSIFSAEEEYEILNPTASKYKSVSSVEPSLEDYITPAPSRFKSFQKR